jgi:bacteriocin biosynthesis cyclodehydratase domain-containing protein
VQLELLQPLHDDRPLLLPLLVTEARPPDARPALAPWCRLVEADGRVLVEHGGTVVTLEGAATRRLLPALLPLLDGSRTVDELARALGDRARPAVESALDLLARHRLLVDGPCVDAGRVEAAAASYAAAVTRGTPADAAAGLADARVLVLGRDVQADEVARQLRRSGVGAVDRTRARPTPDAWDLVVAAPAATELRLLDELGEEWHAQRQPWLQLLPYDGRAIVVGPLVVPDVTGCRACFSIRRAACSGYEEDFDLVAARPLRAMAPFALQAVAAGLAATIALRRVAASDPSLPGRFYTVECGSVLAVVAHRLLRVPRCPTCGPFESAVPSPWFAASA